MLKREPPLIVSEAKGALSRGRNDGGKALSKNGARTDQIGANKLRQWMRRRTGIPAQGRSATERS